MKKCVNCGREIEGEPHKAKAHTRYFDICGNQCKKELEVYLEKDKRFKLPMFLMILAGGLGFLVSALFGKGQYMMLGAYIGQVVGGIAFLLLPYPILSFETFLTVPVKKVTMVCRIIGVFLAGFGMLLLIDMLK